MQKTLFYILLFTVLPFFFVSCKKEIRPTTMTIKDTVRHYYPIKQGQQLDIMFTVSNTGKAPLIITEIQPSCGCIIMDKSSQVIVPEGGSRQFKATYNSIKNVGEVVHRIRLYGNMLPKGRTELKFHVNVVPDADYTRDYEELYQDFNTKNGILREMVDGKETELGYYTGENR